MALLPTLPDNLSGAGLFQSAASIAAVQIASRIQPTTLSNIGKSVNAASAVLSLIQGQPALDMKSPLLGGLSLNEARQMYQMAAGIPYARKNFFYIEIAELNPSTNSPGAFDMLALDVSYTPVSISSDRMRVGAASADGVDGNEPTDIRITTLDDEYGSLKRWYREVAKRVANNADGTCGPPSTYAIDIYVYHAVVNGYDSDGTAVAQPYCDAYRVRPASEELEVSRRDAGLIEVQMSFTQLDTFMTPPNA